MATGATSRDMWRSYRIGFRDHLEATNAAPRTIEAYDLAVEQLGDFLKVEGYPTDPRKVTREHLEAWMRYLMRPVDEGGRGSSAATANQRYRSISRYWKYLLEVEEAVETNPMAKMSPPKIPEKLVPVVGLDALSALLKSMSGRDFESRRDRAIFSLFVDVGLRVSEMADLRLEDIDPEDRTLIVRQGKNRRDRQLRITPESRADLRRYLLARESHPHADSPALWIGKRGPITKSGMYRLVVRRGAAVGLELHPHMLRHSLAHYFRLNGGGDDELMSTMGWRSREMLSRYGASVAEARAAEVHERFSPRRGL